METWSDVISIISGTFCIKSTHFQIPATSNGSALSLANTHGGRCQTHNMRLAVTVCSTGRKCIKDDTLCKTPKGSSADKINTTTTSTTGVPTTNKPDTTTSTTTTDIDGDGVAKPQVLARHGMCVFMTFCCSIFVCLVVSWCA